MVPLSAFRRFQVVDTRLRKASLCEFAVSSLQEDYPCVSSLLFRNASKAEIALPWAAVNSLDFKQRYIQVTNLDEGVAPEEVRGNETLLMRDVLDARIIDLERLHTTRANDLWLEETAGRLLVRAADTGWRALARRICGGFSQPRPSDLCDWRSVEYLRGEPPTGSDRAPYNRRVCHLSAKELGHLADLLPYPHASELLCLLPEQLAADAVEEWSPPPTASLRPG